MAGHRQKKTLQKTRRTRGQVTRMWRMSWAVIAPPLKPNTLHRAHRYVADGQFRPPSRGCAAGRDYRPGADSSSPTNPPPPPPPPSPPSDTPSTYCRRNGVATAACVHVASQLVVSFDAASFPPVSENDRPEQLLSAERLGASPNTGLVYKAPPVKYAANPRADAVPFYQSNTLNGLRGAQKLKAPSRGIHEHARLQESSRRRANTSRTMLALLGPPCFTGEP